MRFQLCLSLALSMLCILQSPCIGQAASPGLVQVEFIYKTAPFASCHASTIVETLDGALVAAWFGGTAEGRSDVGIWVSRHEDGQWTAPVEVANGVQLGDKRHPCWNPVLFQPVAEGTQPPLMLFYKVGPSPSTWWGMLRTSNDGGKTWNQARRLPDGILGPVKNKPVQLGKDILCPSSTENAGWVVHFERTSDLGKTWSRSLPVNDGEAIGAIQPALLTLNNDPAGVTLLALGRTRQKRIFQVTSPDGGKTWGEMSLTSLPNPNSGIDAVTLKDGRHILIYNHTERGRTPLNLAISKDGKQWEAALVLEDEPGEYSYPAIIQTADWLVHVTYTWKRQRIRHAIIDPGKLVGRPIVDGAWPN